MRSSATGVVFSARVETKLELYKDFVEKWD